MLRRSAAKQGERAWCFLLSIELRVGSHLIVTVTVIECVPVAALFYANGKEVLALCAIASGILFVLSQAYFALAPKPANANYVDYACIFLGVIGILSISHPVTELYSNTSRQFQAQGEDAIDRATTTARNYLIYSCRLKDDVAITSAAPTKMTHECLVARNIWEALRRLDPTDLTAVTKLLNGPLMIEDSPLFQHYLRDENGVEMLPVFGNVDMFLRIGQLRLMNAEGYRGKADLLSWTRIMDEDWIKIAASLLVLNVLYVKLGLIIVKIRSAFAKSS